MSEESKSDLVKEARELADDFRFDIQPRVRSSLRALCDEVEELTRRTETQADSIMEFQEEQRAFNAAANELLQALVKAVVYAPNVKAAADALRSAIAPKGSKQ